MKGANLAMEDVDAELGGWTSAPYPTKADVDASYKRLLDRLLDAAAGGGLELGVASHNLFDVAWALDEIRRRRLTDVAEIEMLEGMAPPQARATREEAGRLLLYTPVVTDADFAASIAYLARRLDENAGPENFLRALFTITPGSPVWDDQRGRFEHAVAAAPRRVDDAAPRPGPRAPSTARSTPTRRSPTSPTPTSPSAPTGTGSPATSTPIARRRARRS